MRSGLLLVALLIIIVNAFSQTIELDKNFGENGVLEKIPAEKGNFLYDAMESFAELESKKLITAIFHDNRSYLSRINEDGSTDASFLNNGFSDPYLLEKTKLLKAKDGTLFWVGMQLASPKGISIYKLQKDGTIDPTFGKNGLVQLKAGLKTEWLVDALIQPDGKLLLLQSAPYFNTPGKNIIYRFLANGEVDKSFDYDGKMAVNISGVSRAWSMGISGKRIVVGITLNDEIGIAGFKITGGLDSTFGDNGKTIMAWHKPYRSSNKMIVQPNGIIYVTDVTYSPSPRYSFRVIRFSASGKFDIAFYSSAKGTKEFYTPITVSKIVLDKQSRMFITGTQTHAEGKVTPLIIKLQSYGHFHTSFGNRGVANADTLASEVAVNDALLLSDGNIATVGYINQPIRDPRDADYLGKDFYFIAKTDSLGKPVSQFNENGIATGFVPRSRGGFGDLKLSADKLSLFASYATQADKLTRSYTHVLQNGRIDTGFGNGGFMPANASGSKYVLTGDGKMIVLSVEGRNLVLQRYTNKGLIDDSFGIGGKKVPITFSEFYYSDFVKGTGGAMFVSGSFFDTSDDRYRHTRFILKLTEQGDLDSEFSKNGMLTFSDSESFSPLHLLVQPDGKIVAYGMKDFDGGEMNKVMILRRFLQNGASDTEFGINGIASEYFKESFYPHKIQLMPNGNFLIEQHYSNELGVFNHALVQYDKQGKKQMNFGESGMILNPGGLFYVLDNNKILNVDHPSKAEPNVMGLNMYSSNGMVDSSFGNSGAARVVLALDVLYFDQIVKASDRLYITGLVDSKFDSREIILALKTTADSSIVSSFTLINAKTDKDLIELNDGDEIDLAAISGNAINIRANVTNSIGSLVMQLDGEQSKTVTENIAPYALFGDTIPNNYRSWMAKPGSYTLTTTPYSKAKGKGDAGTVKQVSFKVVYNLTLSHLTLVNSNTNSDITTLEDGLVIDLAKTPQINVRANAGKGYTESVRFDINNSMYIVESRLPYAIAADNQGKYYNWQVTPGTYTIAATPYGQDGARGLSGTPLSVTITIVDTRDNSSMLNSVAVSETGRKLLTEAKELQLSTYPNPAVNNAVAEFSVPETTIVNLVMTDASGKLVQQVFSGVADGGMVHRKTINTATLAPGLYFCYLTTQDGKTKVSKLVKQ